MCYLHFCLLTHDFERQKKAFITLGSNSLGELMLLCPFNIQTLQDVFLAPSETVPLILIVTNYSAIGSKEIDMIKQRVKRMILTS